jgi:hypothetical protein
MTLDIPIDERATHVLAHVADLGLDEDEAAKAVEALEKRGLLLGSQPQGDDLYTRHEPISDPQVPRSWDCACGEMLGFSGNSDWLDDRFARHLEEVAAKLRVRAEEDRAAWADTEEIGGDPCGDLQPGDESLPEAIHG